MSEPNERMNLSARRIVAVRGAKGGAGSSMVASNLGIFLAQIGKRVVLIDANAGDAGLYSWLGTVQPDKNMGDVLYGRVDDISDAITDTRVTGLYLLGGATNVAGGEMQSRERFEFLWRKIKNLETDFIILDLPNSIDYFTLELFCLADHSITVTLPLPDSIEATYRFWIAAWLHSLEGRIDPDNRVALELLDEARRSGGWPRAPRSIVSSLEEMGNPAWTAANELSSVFHPQLVVNQVKLKEDEEMGDAMVSAATRWLGIVPLPLGSVGWDDNVWLSQRRAKPLLIDFAGSRACKDLERIIRRLMSLEYTDLVSPFSIPPKTDEQNYYELLEIFPGASEEEVRRAFRRIRTWFGLEGIACRGACTDDERERFQRLAETAHAKLVDRSERRQYDRNNFPDGFRVGDKNKRHRGSIAGEVAVTQESLPKVELSDDHFVDGEFLGKIRRERNVDLEDISNRAKISVRYLKAIEEERFEDLPAQVFTRGFVTEFARFLKVNPKRACADFMVKYESFFEKRRK